MPYFAAGTSTGMSTSFTVQRRQILSDASCPSTTLSFSNRRWMNPRSFSII